MDTKVCGRCKKELPKDEFSKSNQTRDGLKSWCKECLRVYHRDWYANKGGREKCKIRYQKNRETIKEKCRERSYKKGCRPTAEAKDTGLWL